MKKIKSVILCMLFLFMTAGVKADYQTRIETDPVHASVNRQNIEQFVTRLYNLCLSREPDTSGFNDWVDWLSTGKVDAAGTVSGFFNSQEMKNLSLSDDQYVEYCYMVLMDRTSDTDGKNNWINILDIGLSRQFVLKGFVESNEFSNICLTYGITRGSITTNEWRDNNYGVTAYVSRLYTKALGRQYEVNGLNGWCEKILTKQINAKKVATVGFFHSQEFLNKQLSNTDFVHVLYRTFLDREAEPEGLNSWVGLLNSGYSRDSVIAGFADSTEFKNLMLTYGIIIEDEVVPPSPSPDPEPDPEPDPDPTPTPTGYYILNANSGVFHRPTCVSVKRMSESNKVVMYLTRTQMIAKGYSPCHNCNP